MFFYLELLIITKMSLQMFFSLKILEVADICCQGKVVSVLEGGYGRTPSSNRNGSSPSKADEGGNMLDKTVFAECAIRHLRAMIDPFDEEKLH